LFYFYVFLQQIKRHNSACSNCYTHTILIGQCHYQTVELKLQQFRYVLSLSYKVRGHVSSTYKDIVTERFR